VPVKRLHPSLIAQHTAAVSVQTPTAPLSADAVMGAYCPAAAAPVRLQRSCSAFCWNSLTLLSLLLPPSLLFVLNADAMVSPSELLEALHHWLAVQELNLHTCDNAQHHEGGMNKDLLVSSLWLCVEQSLCVAAAGRVVPTPLSCARMLLPCCMANSQLQGLYYCWSVLKELCKDYRATAATKVRARGTAPLPTLLRHHTSR
jgi:hypothetical protein